MPRGSQEGIRHATKFRWPPWRERFESYVDREPGFGPQGACHRWTGPITGYPGNQYGVIQIAGRRRRAHQVAWEIAHRRRWPIGKLALHSCDVGICVNPAHVRPGTQAENMAEARARGRLNSTPPAPGYRARGEGHTNARLATADIPRIRAGYRQGRTVANLARAYGVSWNTIDKIVKRQTWRHVT